MVWVRPMDGVAGWLRGRGLVGVEQLRQLRRQIAARRRRELPSTELSDVRRRWSDRDAQPVVVNPQAAVESLLEGDRAPGPAAPVAPPRQGKITTRPADRAVTADPPGIVEAEHRLGAQPVGPGAPGGGRVSGGDREPRVVAFEEARQEDVGRLDRGDPREPQLGHEAVLERVPQALDPALRLRRAGPDPADARLLERPADLM